VFGRLAALSLIAGTVLPASGALAAAQHRPLPGGGGIGIRLIGVPGGQTDALGRLYVVARVAPGTSIRRRVEISNTTTAMADITVYPAAAGIVRGAFTFGAADHGQDELSRWTSVSRHVMRLPPGTGVSDILTINVPGDASPGERYAVLWAQVSAPSAEGSVKIVNRVGVRMYVSIGPGGAPAPNFTIDSLAAKRSAAGRPLVTAKIHNSGGSTLAISGSLNLSHGPGDLHAGPFPARLGAMIAPGASQPVTVSLSKGLPDGPWRARLWLTSGLLRRSAAATITFPGPAGKSASPWLIVSVILLALLVASVAALVITRRARFRFPQRHGRMTRPADPPADRRVTRW
jgi:hypothetical protein